MPMKSKNSTLGMLIELLGSFYRNFSVDESTEVGSNGIKLHTIDNLLVKKHTFVAY
jgi:hypothetical protein